MESALYAISALILTCAFGAAAVVVAHAILVRVGQYAAERRADAELARRVVACREHENSLRQQEIENTRRSLDLREREIALDEREFEGLEDDEEGEGWKKPS